MRYRQELKVPFAYDIVFTRGLFEPQNEALLETLPEGGPHKLAFFVDESVLGAWPKLPQAISDWCAARKDRIHLVTNPVIVPGGEAVKNDLMFVQRMTHQYQRLELCRHSFVAALGGGAVLDAVGLSAAVFHRGLRLLRIPTTVLAQGDSAVGVKNGVNLDGVKNLIGTFAPPYAVLNDLRFLTSLSRRDWCSGISEMFKVAAIRDHMFLDRLEKLAPRLAARDLDAMEEAVRCGALLHAGHIRMGGDPFEMGSARPLDFGHWSAHKLESMTQYQVRHGEAVAIGVALDLHVASSLGYISIAERDRVCRAMEACGMALWHPTLAKRSGVTGKLQIVAGLEEFRQHLGGQLTLTMPDGLGKSREIHELRGELVEAGVLWLASRQPQPNEVPAALQ